MIVHASCVALGGRGVLILGGSGTGKSALALQLMAYGAALVSDDRTILSNQGGALQAAAPDTIRGRIEARGIGILNAAAADPCRVVLAIDMDRVETARMPPPRDWTACDATVPLLHKVESLHFAAAILQYLESGPAEI